jgi:hypothetical protein
VCGGSSGGDGEGAAGSERRRAWRSLREGEEKEERRGEAVESAVEEQVESEDERVLTQGSHMGDEEMGGGRRGGRDAKMGTCSVFSFGAGEGRKRVGVALVSGSLSFRFGFQTFQVWILKETPLFHSSPSKLLGFVNCTRASF